MGRKLGPENLRQYQWKAIHYAQGHEQCALLLDMGLGKTVSLLTLIKSLLLLPQAGIRTWLGVAPLRVMKGVWQQEGQKWSHTRDVVFSVVHGSETKRRDALQQPAHVYLINPEGLVWLVDWMQRLELDKPGLWPFDGLFIDESSMFKSHRTKRFEAISKVLPLFKRRIIMTGTPTPNSLRELWPQMYILDMGERLGSVYWRFEKRFFESDYTGYHLELRDGARGMIERAVRDVVLRLDADDWLELPPVIGLDAEPGGPCDVMIDLPDDARELYNRIEKDMFLELEKADVEAISAAVLTQKCHQIANGAIYGEDRATGDRIWEVVHDAKLDAVEEIVDECGGPIIIAYQFNHDLQRLRAKFKDFAVVKDLKIEDFERDWNAGKYPGALIHPKSAGHGLNLQDGGRNLCFYSLTWSTEQIDQIVARIGPTRQAQAGRTTEPIKVYRIIARDTTDMAICASNAAKAHGQRAMLNALRQYQATRGGTVAAPPPERTKRAILRRTA